MTTADTEAAIGRMVLAYEQLVRKRACLRRRLRDGGRSLSPIVHALEHWDTSTHVSEVTERLEASKMDALREDVASMIEVEKEIAQTEEDLREAGLPNLIRKRR